MTNWFRSGVQKSDWAYLVAVLVSFFLVFITGELATNPGNDTNYPLALGIAIAGYGLVLLISVAPKWLWLRILLLAIGNAYVAYVMFGIQL